MAVKTFANLIAFTLIISATHASTQEKTTEVISISNYNMSVTTIYQNMSTAQLQEEVEKHSNNGNLSFAMGQELIKRWTEI